MANVKDLLRAIPTIEAVTGDLAHVGLLADALEVDSAWLGSGTGLGSVVDNMRASARAIRGLQAQIHELAAQNAAMRKALEFIQFRDGDITPLRVQEALALPNTADFILKKRDAETLRNAAGKLEYGVRKTMADQLCEMADELEAEK